MIMPSKIKCKLNKEELEYLYHKKGMSQVELCNVLGVKSFITVKRMLHEYGINTNKNQIRSNITKQGRSDPEFKQYLENLYYNELFSINQIARELDVTSETIRKYFKQYGIVFRSQKEVYDLSSRGSNNPRWRGGRNIKSNGYIEVYMPNHPYCDKRGYVYEHRLIVEKHIGRLLENDEIIHHIDFNTRNNNISNLKIMKRDEHKKLHNLLKASKKKKEGGFNGNK